MAKKKAGKNEMASASSVGDLPAGLDLSHAEPIPVSAGSLYVQVRTWMIDVLTSRGCTSAATALDLIRLWKFICAAHGIDQSSDFANSVMSCILTLTDHDTATFTEVHSAFVYLT
ncbi:MAG TPA: hypothetical protein VG826_36275 [Pirellulales bacterium]|nr:hypothetical protein [Pirellulales bacterium]